MAAQAAAVHASCSHPHGPGRSPAFQHGHSHAHLASQLQGRKLTGPGAAAPAPDAFSPGKAQNQRQQQQSQGGVPADEGPLHLPPDIPEGVRVAATERSRPGIQEVAGAGVWQGPRDMGRRLDGSLKSLWALEGGHG